MAKDELHNLNGGGGGGGVSIDERSRNVNQKKLPRRRGLGIAQLEKLRLDEEMRKRKSHVHLSGDGQREKVARRGLGIAQLEKMRLDEEMRKRESLYYNNLAVNYASPAVYFYFLQPASAVNIDENYAWLYNSNKMAGVKREFIFSHFDPSSVATKSRLVYPNPRDSADANGEAIDLTLKL